VTWIDRVVQDERHMTGQFACFLSAMRNSADQRKYKQLINHRWHIRLTWTLDRSSDRQHNCSVRSNQLARCMPEVRERHADVTALAIVQYKIVRGTHAEDACGRGARALDFSCCTHIFSMITKRRFASMMRGGVHLLLRADSTGKQFSALICARRA
jgi:hypothetical protein